MKGSMRGFNFKLVFTEAGKAFLRRRIEMKSKLQSSWLILMSKIIINSKLLSRKIKWVIQYKYLIESNIKLNKIILIVSVLIYFLCLYLNIFYLRDLNNNLEYYIKEYVEVHILMSSLPCLFTINR